MAFEAAASALGHLMLDQRRQEAGRRPALLVGLGGERRPGFFDRGQAHLGEQQLEARQVDRIGGLHGAAPAWTSVSAGAGLPISS